MNYKKLATIFLPLVLGIVLVLPFATDTAKAADDVEICLVSAADAYKLCAVQYFLLCHSKKSSQEKIIILISSELSAR
mgnify:CR=1 FL=1